jgi:hypothetical protein
MGFTLNEKRQALRPCQNTSNIYNLTYIFLNANLFLTYVARMAELADALDSGSSSRKAVGVRLPLRAI